MKQSSPTSTLIRDGVLKIAANPRSNPGHLNFEAYTLPLIQDDYPARTAAMWNGAYAEFQMPFGNVMLAGDPANAPQILQAFRNDPKYLGGGAGVGFKEALLPHLDELDERARLTGSVNFIAKQANGALRGYNSDGLGFLRGVEEALALRGETVARKRAVLLGAGGTASAVAFALVEHGCRIVILNRTVARARALAERINAYLGKTLAQFGPEEDLESIAGTADLVINLSTKGSSAELAEYSALAPAILPATAENISRNLTGTERVWSVLAKQALLCDVVLSSQETPFLREARVRGFTTLNGVAMVIHQGVAAFCILHAQRLNEKGILKSRVAEVMRAYAG